MPNAILTEGGLSTNLHAQVIRTHHYVDVWDITFRQITPVQRSAAHR